MTRLKVKYSGCGSDVVGAYNPATDRLLFLHAQEEFDQNPREENENTPGIKFTPRHTSRTGCTGSGVAESETHLLFRCGTFRQDAPKEPVSWEVFPLALEWEISVGVTNRNHEGNTGWGNRIIWRRKFSPEGESEARWLLHAKHTGARFATRRNIIIELAREGKPLTLKFHKNEETFSLAKNGVDVFGVNVLRMTQPDRAEVDRALECGARQLGGEESSESEYLKSMQGLAAALGYVPIVWDYTSGYARFDYGRVKDFIEPHHLAEKKVPGWTWDEARKIFWRIGRREILIVAWDGCDEFEISGIDTLDALAERAHAGRVKKKEEIIKAEERARLEKISTTELFQKSLDALASTGEILSLQSSLNAGNCEEGTRRFMKKYELPEMIGARDLKAHPRLGEMAADRNFRRTITKAGEKKDA